jgi:cell division protein ZapA
MKQIEVQIMGQGYLLGCPEGGEEPLRSAVSKVDTAMCKIRDSGKVKARDRIAVLAALNLAFDENPVAAVTAVPASVEAKLPPMSVTRLSADADPRVASLIERLDRALSFDGQLI